MAAIDSQFAVFPAGEKFLPANRAHSFARRFPMLRHRVVIPPQSAACVGAKFPVPACPVLHNGSAALRAELMHHAIQKFLFVLFHRVSPRMLHLAAKPLCFLRKAGKRPENDGVFTHHFHREYLLGKEASVCCILLSLQTKSHGIPAISEKIPDFISCFVRFQSKYKCFPHAPDLLLSFCAGLSDPRAVKFAVLYV